MSALSFNAIVYQGQDLKEIWFNPGKHHTHTGMFIVLCWINLDPSFRVFHSKALPFTAPLKQYLENYIQCAVLHPYLYIYTRKYIKKIKPSIPVGHVAKEKSNE